MPDEQTTTEPIVAAAPEAEKPRDAAELNGIAADYITRLVGIPETAARHEVGQLIDAEVDEIIAASAADRHSAKDIIKAVLARAYDRRRESAAHEASAEMETLRRSSAAQQAIEKHTAIKGEKAAKVVALLKADERTELGQLADDPTAGESVAAVLNAAEARINAAFAASAAAGQENSEFRIQNSEPSLPKPVAPVAAPLVTEPAVAAPPAASAS